LGHNKLLVISIIRIVDIQQIAGDIVTYNNIEDIPKKLPGMVNKIVAAARTTSASLPKLAVPTLQLEDGADKGDADVLAQILAIYLIHSGKYAVYPRTSSLEQVLVEHRNQRIGFAADEYIAELGRGVNPDKALGVIARKLGNQTMFNAAIYDLETGIQETGTSENYTTLDDGIQVMEAIAKKLTDNRTIFSDNARLFSIGASVGSSFTAPWLIGTLQGTFSVLPYTFFDIGCDFGFIHGYEGWEDIDYHSFYPFAHLNGFPPLPFSRYVRCFVGVGGGYMMAFYSGSGEDNAFYVPAFDVATGLYIGKNHHYATLVYSVRTTFEAVNHKAALGYSFRFR
jgi:hypothetical protein